MGKLIESEESEDFSKDKTGFQEVIRRIYGSQTHDGMYHYVGFSSKFLKKYLENNNFKYINSSFENYNFTLIMERLK